MAITIYLLVISS